MRKAAIKAYNCRIKSKHLSARLSLSELQKLQKDDAAFLETQVFYIGELRRQKEQQKSIPKGDINEIRGKLEELSLNYEFGNDVEDYLENKPFLIETLFEAVKKIYCYFGEQTPLRLEILKDGASEKLFVLIHVGLEPEEANENLNSFDNEWWFKQSKNIHKRLEFSLEFD